MFDLIPKVYAACDASEKAGDGNIDLGCVLKLNNGQAVKDVYTSPAFLVNLLVKNIFVVAGFYIFIMILFAGFKFISNGTKGKDEAKSIMTACLIGLVVMIAAYWIIQILQVLTGVDVGLATNP